MENKLEKYYNDKFRLEQMPEFNMLAEEQKDIVEKLTAYQVWLLGEAWRDFVNVFKLEFKKLFKI